MNIVKVKSIKDNGEAVMFSGLYCWCIRWTHIVSFDDYSIDEVMQAERDGVLKDSKPHASFDDYMDAGYIDTTQTAKANSIDKWVEYNKFNPDGDITVDELKRFRTWLAETLLTLDMDTAEQPVVEMLRYYAEEMHDSTVSHLDMFAATGVTLDVVAKSSTCACNSMLNVDTMGAASLCDAVAMYRKGVYNRMVKVFSDLSFWTEREQDFLNEFKLYIDGIIKCEFPLYSSNAVLSGFESSIRDCSCLTKANTAEQNAMLMLKNLSTALQYIINEQVSGNRNFIAQAFNEWAAYLYEKMRW